MDFFGIAIMILFKISPVCYLIPFIYPVRHLHLLPFIYNFMYQTQSTFL